jgi:hypothetical protein
MPSICTFYGIEIRMFYDDHPPPHFHAVYAGYSAQVVIATGEILNGSLPARAQRLVREWAELRRSALLEDWDLSADKQPLKRIEPLE